MTYLGCYAEYQVFKNSDGYLEGYKSKGGKIQIDETTFAHKDLERIVTICTTPEEFVLFVAGKRPKAKKIKQTDLPEFPF